MLASTFLDTAIGIIFVFLLLSIIATTINEIIQSFLNMRGRTLLEGIKTLLNDDPKLVSSIYNHGQIYGLFRGEFNPSKSWRERYKAWKALFKSSKDSSSGKENKAENGAVPPPPAPPANPSQSAPPPKTRRNLPSYIPSANFASAFLGVLAAEAKAELDRQVKVGNTDCAAKAVQDAETNVETAKKAAADLAAAAKKANDEVNRIVSDLTSAPGLGDMARKRAYDAQAAATDAAKAVDLASSVALIQLLRFGATNLDDKIGKPLLGILETANNDINKLKTGVETWYNSAMDRISGWYKYNTQWVLFWIGLAMAISLNADTVNIVKQISRSDTLRQSLVAAAHKAPNPSEKPKEPAPNPPNDAGKKADGQNGSSPGSGGMQAQAPTNVTTAWEPDHVYKVGDMICTNGAGGCTSGGNYVQTVSAVQNEGKSGNSAPTWSQNIGGEIPDNNVTWKNIGYAPSDLKNQFTQVADQISAVENLGLPIGWGNCAFPTGWPPFYHAKDIPQSQRDCAIEEGSSPRPLAVRSYEGWFALGGWMLTAIAVSLGAPFWFDLLNKFMIVRSTVKPQEKSQEEGSKDKQP